MINPRICAEHMGQVMVSDVEPPCAMCETESKLAEARAEIERISREATQILIQRDQSWRDLVKSQGELSEARAEAEKWRRIREQSHGNCCQCQGCGLDHDECRCDLDDVNDELEQTQGEVERLRRIMVRMSDFLESEEDFDDSAADGVSVRDVWIKELRDAAGDK